MKRAHQDLHGGGVLVGQLGLAVVLEARRHCHLGVAAPRQHLPLLLRREAARQQQLVVGLLKDTGLLSQQSRGVDSSLKGDRTQALSKTSTYMSPVSWSRHEPRL